MFGKTLMLDMYGCAEGTCDDMELHYRFLEELVDRLNMVPLCPPVVIHAPIEFRYEIDDKNTLLPQLKVNNGKKRFEKYPDKSGISAWIGLITSGCQVHSIEPSHFSALDIFTCGHLDVDEAVKFAKETFKFSEHEAHVVERGMKYG